MRLNYDIDLTISTAPSVFGPWQNTRMQLSGLYTRLSEPIRGQESHTAFMKWPKKQQDRAKNVGGFVGGELTDNVRKNGHCLNRCLVTLDVDRMAKGTTMALINAMRFKLLTSWCVYSTRKHSEDAPRLRIVVPLSSPIGPDLYEPLARAIAVTLDRTMNVFDRTTFQAIRAMYWPSASCDSDYVFQYQDGPLLDPMAFMDEHLPNWKDIGSWPKCPDEDTIREKKAETAQDPTEKEGIVGAFCRQYDIESAIAEFLPGVYEECGEGRYTYTMGTSTGGAIVYQNGKFIYSHHATDPACDMLCNAFDLVRIHKFGNLDDGAKEGTPVGRMPSYKAMCDFAENLGDVKEAVTSERRERLMEEAKKLDQFITPDVYNAPKAAKASEYNKIPAVESYLSDEDVEILDPRNKVTTDMVLAAMHGRGITVARNVINNKVAVSGLEGKFSRQEAANTVTVVLSDYLRNKCKINVSPSQVSDYIGVIADQHRFNPVVNWLDNAGEWDGYDRIKDLAEILGINKEGSKYDLYRTFLRKWLMQCVALAYSNDYDPISADGALVLQGEQGKGKTLFFRTISVCSEWFGEGLVIDMQDKDTKLAATSYWIGELGELDSTVKKEQSSLKAFITAETDNIRAPYARASSERARRTSFCGTVNPEDYLRDETGARRFWTIHVEKVDIERLLAMTEDYKTQLWLQVKSLYQHDPTGYRLNDRERQLAVDQNWSYTQKLQWQEELEDIFDYELPYSKWVELSPATLGRIVPGVRIEARQVSRILSMIARNHRGPNGEQIEQRRSHGKRMWCVPVKSIYLGGDPS